MRQQSQINKANVVNSLNDLGSFKSKEINPANDKTVEIVISKSAGHGNEGALITPAQKENIFTMLIISETSSRRKNVFELAIA